MLCMTALIALSSTMSAQYIVSTDTLTDAGTVTVTVPGNFSYYGDLQCGFVVTNISGTTAGTAALRASATPAGSYYNLLTTSLSDAQDTMLTSGLVGVKGQIKYTGSGTQSTQIVTSCAYKRRY